MLTESGPWKGDLADLWICEAYVNMAGEVKDGERIDVYKDRCLKDDYVYNYVYVLCFVIIE